MNSSKYGLLGTCNCASMVDAVLLRGCMLDFEISAHTIVFAHLTVSF